MEAKKILLISVIVVFLVIVAVFIFQITRSKPDPISVQCAFACDSGQKSSFCLVERTLKDKTNVTCSDLSSNPIYSSYNVLKCPSMPCTVSAKEADQTCVIGLGGKWVIPVGGTCPQTGDKIVRKLTPSDQPPVNGQICCG